MPNVLDSISPGFKALVAMLAAASFNAAELLATNDVNALKLKLESLPGKSADVAQAVTEATAALTTQLTEKNQTATAALAQVTVFKAGLTKAGLPSEALAKEGLTADEVHAAFAARASIMASEQLAKHGLKDPLPVTPSADNSKPNETSKPALKGRERTVAAFAAQSARKTVL